MDGTEPTRIRAAFRSDLARAAAAIADRFQRSAVEAEGEPFITDADRATWLRRILEEMGAHCEDSPQLSDLRGFLISSPRGLEAIVSAALNDSERLRLYAHFFAHVLMGDTEGPISVCLEYTDAAGARVRSIQEQKQEGMAEAVAQAMLRGRLERTPRYLYYRDPPAPAEADLWATVRRRAGTVLHRISLALFRRSRRYQRVRSWNITTRVVRRVQNVLAA